LTPISLATSFGPNARYWTSEQQIGLLPTAARGLLVAFPFGEAEPKRSADDGRDGQIRI
jgi:hypothetical protein